MAALDHFIDLRCLRISAAVDALVARQRTCVRQASPAD